MSAKKQKSESADSHCFIGPNFAPSILRLISSFFSPRERAKDFERVAAHFKAASRHPSSFGDSIVNFEQALTVDFLSEWLRLYSSPPLRRLLVQNDATGDEASPSVLLAASAFGSTLQTLQFGHAGATLAPWSEWDIFVVGRLTSDRRLTRPASFGKLTDVVNFLEVASQEPLVQGLRLLGVTFATSGIRWFRWNAESKYLEHKFEPLSIKPENPKQLPRLEKLWINKPDKLQLPDSDIPEWIRNKYPDLKPDWVTKMCPNIKRFGFPNPVSRFADEYYFFPTEVFSM